MTINLRTEILNYDNRPVTFQKDKGETIEIVNLTVGEALIQALNNLAQTGNEYQPAELLSASDKTRIYGLSVKIYQATDTLELSTDDVEFLKNRIGKIWNAIVIGRMNEIFDNGKQQDYTSSNDADAASQN